MEFLIHDPGPPLATLLLLALSTAPGMAQKIVV